MELFTKNPFSAHKTCRKEPKPKCHPHRWVNTKQCLSCLPSHNSNSDEKTTRVKNNPKCTREWVVRACTFSWWVSLMEAGLKRGSEGRGCRPGPLPSFLLFVWDRPMGLCLPTREWSPNMNLWELRIQSPYKNRLHDQNTHLENEVRLHKSRNWLFTAFP